MDSPRIVRSRSMLLAPLLAMASGAAAQVPTQWTIELQCRSSLDPGIVPFNLPFPSSLSSQSVALDQDGSVVTRVVLAGAATEGIFLGQNGAGGIILSVNDPEPIWSSGLDHENNRVAVQRLDGTSITTYDESGAPIDVFGPGGSEGISGLSTPSLNSAGAVGYRGDFGTFRKLIIDQFIGGVRTQVSRGNTFSGTYSFLFSPRLNNAGEMASNTILQNGSTRRIARWDPAGNPTTIVETGATWNAFVNSIGFSNPPTAGGAGHVAFSARRASDSIWEVRRTDGLGTIRVAQGGDMNIQSSDLANFPVAVNRSGWVAFRAKDDSNAAALFVGDGQTLVRIARAGDMMPTDLGPIVGGFNFGGTTGVQFINANVDINDAGQVAFACFLENGTIGVYVATPVETCAGDWDASGGQPNSSDFLAYLNDWSANEPRADLAPAGGDGTWDSSDFLAYLNLYSAGC
ncbi:MAG: GC-type dockerin domain-anchored protein [Phycisphaerales bacterium]|jgi:hypothetical protein|nr:GC-type dockerin domain-anchored protein [Phycisphaerales bacterium]